MQNLESYYKKFNEDHRLKTRHGQVEFFVTMHYIKKFLSQIAAQSDIAENEKIKILDVGAATGAYSIPLCREGFDVTAVELTKTNFDILRLKHENIKCWNADARDLNFLVDETFDITLLLGPLYHLHAQEEKLQTLLEARRVTKKGGVIFAGYVMNEYAILTYCFGKNKIKENFSKRQVSENFQTICGEDDLYSYSRREEIDFLAKESRLERAAIFSPDGPSDYMRRELNSFDEETFELFKKYALCISARPDLLGAGSHLVDVLKK